MPWRSTAIHRRCLVETVSMTMVCRSLVRFRPLYTDATLATDYVGIITAAFLGICLASVSSPSADDYTSMLEVVCARATASSHSWVLFGRLPSRIRCWVSRVLSTSRRILDQVAVCSEPLFIVDDVNVRLTMIRTVAAGDRVSVDVNSWSRRHGWRRRDVFIQFPPPTCACPTTGWYNGQLQPQANADQFQSRSCAVPSEVYPFINSARRSSRQQCACHTSQYRWYCGAFDTKPDNNWHIVASPHCSLSFTTTGLLVWWRLPPSEVLTPSSVTDNVDCRQKQ